MNMDNQKHGFSKLFTKNNILIAHGEKIVLLDGVVKLIIMVII